MSVVERLLVPGESKVMDVGHVHTRSSSDPRIAEEPCDRVLPYKNPHGYLKLLIYYR